MARRETIALSLRWQCLALALFATAGCTVEIRASPPPTVVIPGPGTGEWYDLALVSLGFDPPLSSVSSIEAARQVRLVAVVDNRGTRPAQDVVVTAIVRTADSGEIKAVQTSIVERLAPGEARVVRFGYLDGAPEASRYVVAVRIAPVLGETHVENNEGTLYVTIERH